MYRICLTAGKPRRAGPLLCRSGLTGRGRRRAVLCRDAPGLPALRHRDVVLLRRRHAAVRAALVDLLGRDGGEAGRLGRRFSCCAGGITVSRGRARSGPPGSCRAGTHTHGAHNAVCSCRAAWRLGCPLACRALSGAAGLRRGCPCRARLSGGRDMRGAPTRPGGNGGLPCGTALVGRCALRPAVCASHSGGGPRALLPGVCVLAAKLHHGPLGGSGLRGMARRLRSGTSRRGAGLLADWGFRSGGAACCSCPAGNVRPAGYRARPGAIRPAARRRCAAAMPLPPAFLPADLATCWPTARTTA